MEKSGSISEASLNVFLTGRFEVSKRLQCGSYVFEDPWTLLPVILNALFKLNGTKCCQWQQRHLHCPSLFIVPKTKKYFRRVTVCYHFCFFGRSFFCVVCSYKFLVLDELTVCAPSGAVNLTILATLIRTGWITVYQQKSYHNHRGRWRNHQATILTTRGSRNDAYRIAQSVQWWTSDRWWANNLIRQIDFYLGQLTWTRKMYWERWTTCGNGAWWTTFSDETKSETSVKE